MAVIGDIVNSKNLSNRNAFQQNLQSNLSRLNLKYKDALASPFMITLGDEFQGLIHDPSELMEIADFNRIRLYDKARFRIGIGVGEIVTDIDPDSSLGADGPAYWKAREALEHIRENDDYGRTDIAMCFGEGICRDSTQELVNNTLRLCGLIEHRWSKGQLATAHMVVSKYGYSENFTQKEVADDLNSSSQHVNHIFQSSGLFQYLDAKREINTVIGRLVTNGGEQQ